MYSTDLTSGPGRPEPFTVSCGPVGSRGSQPVPPRRPNLRLSPSVDGLHRRRSLRSPCYRAHSACGMPVSLPNLIFSAETRMNGHQHRAITSRAHQAQVCCRSRIAKQAPPTRLSMIGCFLLSNICSGEPDEWRRNAQGLVF